MSATDKELWANLYIFCYSAPNRTTSLAGNHRARPSACGPKGAQSACHLPGVGGQAGQGGLPAALLLLPGQPPPPALCPCPCSQPRPGDRWEGTHWGLRPHARGTPSFCGCSRAVKGPARTFDAWGRRAQVAQHLLGSCLPLPVPGRPLGARGGGVRTQQSGQPGAGGGAQGPLWPPAGPRPGRKQDPSVWVSPGPISWGPGRRAARGPGPTRPRIVLEAVV